MALWKPITLNDKFYIFKCVKTDEIEEKLSYWLSDFKCIWREELPTPIVLERSKSENPIIEYEAKQILDTIMNPAQHQRLEVVENHEKDVSSSPASLILRLKYYVSDLPFTYFWNLKIADADTFFEEITKSLLMSLVQTQRLNVAMLEVIQQKETEIEQYKLDGATLVRKHLATTPFQQSEIDRKCRVRNLELSFLNLTAATDENQGLSEVKSLCNITNETENDKMDLEESKTGNFVNKLTSPSKNNQKRSFKELAARRKFQAKADVKIVYNNDDSGDEHDVNPDQSQGVPPSITVAAADKLNKSPSKGNDTQNAAQPKRSKIRTKLNL